MKTRVLVIDDEAAMCQLLQEALTDRGMHVEWRLCGDEAFSLLRERDFDVIVTDLQLGDVNGLDLCQRFTESRPDIPVIVITGFGNMSSAVQAIRAGAYDFINKPVEVAALALAIERAAQRRKLQGEVKRLKEVWAKQRGTGELMGRSPAMASVYDMIERVARTDTTVLLSGESGTGKEVAARALHSASNRAARPFVAINCAAVPANLLESELFGHMKGAFTDAKGTRQGLFQQANDGTLLLDEIGEMPPEMQPKLLRVLQERQIRPVGGNTVVDVNVRVIAATNRDLETEVEAGRFREDLYYRLNVVQIHIPPLRTRGDDILLLAGHFIRKFAERSGKPVLGISAGAAERLLDYDWPGNVRQLENCIERAVALTNFEEIVPEDLPARVGRQERTMAGAESMDSGHLTLDELEKRCIQNALRNSGGNKTQAARLLGVDRRTLYRKLERYGEPASVQSHELAKCGAASAEVDGWSEAEFPAKAAI